MTPLIYVVYAHNRKDSFWLSLQAAKHRASMLYADLRAKGTPCSVTVESAPINSKLNKWICDIEFGADDEVYNQTFCERLRDTSYPT